MSALLTSHEFSKRDRIAKRREWLGVLAGAAPVAIYLLQSGLREGAPLPGLTSATDTAISWVLIGWLAFALFGAGRIARKTAGMTCPACRQPFREESFDFVVKTGSCPNCHGRILSDVASSAIDSVGEVVFQYPRRIAVIGLISIPVIGGLGLLLIFGMVDVLLTSTFTSKRTIAAFSMILFGSAMVALVVILGRSWRSVLSEYTLSREGVAIRHRHNLTFHTWQDLESATYRRVLNQLELRFKGDPTLVALANTAQDPDSTTLKWAIQLVQSHGAVSIKRVVL